MAFSLDKLNWLNGVYIRQLAPEELAARVLPSCRKMGFARPRPPERFAYLVRIIPLVQERIKLLTEISEQTAYFFQEEIPVPPPELLTGKKSSAGEVRELLAAALKVLEGVADFSAAALEEALRKLAAELGQKPGALFMPIRVAITGRTATPGLFETMEAIGKPRVLRRIQTAISGLA